MSETSANKLSSKTGQSQTQPFGDMVDAPLPTDELVVNYFNYFTEIEEHFVRRRGKHLYVSSLDWAIIESWKDMGIPLHIVLRGIDRVFDAREASPRPGFGKLINSIIYCQQEVLTCFEEYRHSRVGAKAEGSASSASGSSAASPFSSEVVLGYLTRRKELLEDFARSLDQNQAMSPMQEAVQRAKARLREIIHDAESAQTLNLESLEQELTRLEKTIYETLLQCIPASELETVRKEGKRQLRTYKKRMSREIYQQTLENYVTKRLQENCRMPRLSLFYM